MNKETILDFPGEAKSGSSNKLKHFGLFYFIQIIITIFIYWIGHDAKANTTEMNLLSLSAFIVPLALTALMIRTYKSNIVLKFYDKIIPILGLLLVEFLTTIFLNFIRAFGRKISSDELIEGLKVTSLAYLAVFIPLCLICGAIIKSRKS